MGADFSYKNGGWKLNSEIGAVAAIQGKAVCNLGKGLDSTFAINVKYKA